MPQLRTAEEIRNDPERERWIPPYQFERLKAALLFDCPAEDIEQIKVDREGNILGIRRRAVTGSAKVYGVYGSPGQ